MHWGESCDKQGLKHPQLENYICWEHYLLHHTVESHFCTTAHIVLCHKESKQAPDALISKHTSKLYEASLGDMSTRHIHRVINLLLFCFLSHPLHVHILQLHTFGNHQLLFDSSQHQTLNVYFLNGIQPQISNAANLLVLLYLLWHYINSLCTGACGEHTPQKWWKAVCNNDEWHWQ